jgi:hypothetical protein
VTELFGAGDDSWTTAEVERCLFLAELEAKGGPATSQGGERKREGSPAAKGTTGKKQKKGD